MKAKVEANWNYEEKKKSKWEEFRENAYGLALMMWDGLGFFGTDHTKLGRLKGEKVDFSTPFKSPRTLVLYIMLLVLMIYIIVSEA